MWDSSSPISTPLTINSAGKRLGVFTCLQRRSLLCSSAESPRTGHRGANLITDDDILCVGKGREDAGDGCQVIGVDDGLLCAHELCQTLLQ